MYLSHYETVTIFHLKDLMSGKCTRIKSKDIKHISVPCFKGLKIERMLEFAEKYPEAMKVLPIVDKEREKLPR